MLHLIGSIVVFLMMVTIAAAIYLEQKGMIEFSDKAFVWAIVCEIVLAMILF